VQLPQSPLASDPSAILLSRPSADFEPAASNRAATNEEFTVRWRDPPISASSEVLDGSLHRELIAKFGGSPGLRIFQVVDLTHFSSKNHADLAFPTTNHSLVEANKRVAIQHGK